MLSITFPDLPQGLTDIQWEGLLHMLHRCSNFKDKWDLQFPISLSPASGSMPTFPSIPQLTYSHATEAAQVLSKNTTTQFQHSNLTPCQEATLTAHIQQEQVYNNRTLPCCLIILATLLICTYTTTSTPTYGILPFSQKISVPDWLASVH